MPKCDRTTVQIDLVINLVGQSKILEYRQRLSRKRFIEFDMINIVDTHARALQRFLCRRNRTVTHDSRITATDCHAPYLGQRLETKTVGFFAGHQQHR